MSCNFGPLVVHSHVKTLYKYAVEKNFIDVVRSAVIDRFFVMFAGPRKLLPWFLTSILLEAVELANHP